MVLIDRAAGVAQRKLGCKAAWTGRNAQRVAVVESARIESHLEVAGVAPARLGSRGPKGDRTGRGSHRWLRGQWCRSARGRSGGAGRGREGALHAPIQSTLVP